MGAINATIIQIKAPDNCSTPLVWSWYHVKSNNSTIVHHTVLMDPCGAEVRIIGANTSIPQIPSPWLLCFPGRYVGKFKCVMLQHILMIDTLSSSSKIVHRHHKSILVLVKAWCYQATSHFLDQCWLNSMSYFGVTRGQWVYNICGIFMLKKYGKCGYIYISSVQARS